MNSQSNKRIGKPTCVVVGLHQNGLGVARALGRQGVRVIGVDSPELHGYSATRYATFVPCPDLRGVGLVQTLREIGASLDEPGVLILTLDRSVLTISEHRAAIEPYYRHSLPDASTIDRLMNKADTDRFAQANGFSVPRTWVIENEDQLDACMRDVDMPCILKPQVKTVEFVERSPKKAFFVRSRDELRDIWHMVSQWEPGVVVQEWIPGPDTSLVFALYYFDRETRPLASFTGHKLRQYIPRCGTACAAEPWDDQGMGEAGVRFFQAAGYRGFGAIEFKIDERGQYYLIEPTVGRTEHIFALAAANGVNIPYVGYCDMAGLPVPEMRTRTSRRVVYVDWKRDFRAARMMIREQELTTSAWIRSVAGPTQHALFAWDDPAPFATTVTRHAATKTSRVAKRIGASLARRLGHARERIDAHGGLDASLRPRTAPLDAGIHLDEALRWLCSAQDAAGEGVARAYSVSPQSSYARGWQPAYPETTGYIIPTLFDCGRVLGRDDLTARARRMAEWELSVQHQSGGFPGGTIDRHPVPVVFNTGMVLLGLTRAFLETRDSRYESAIRGAADFLVRNQSNDGAWRRFANVSGDVNVHAYDCLVNLGLVSAARALDDDRWIEAARRNLEFTLTLQTPNGWFALNALRPRRNATPPTHTIAYAMAGLLETGTLLNEHRFVNAAATAADALIDRLAPNGFLAGEFDRNWAPAATWSCLTGTAQATIVWWRLFQMRGDARYAHAARRALDYLKCRQEIGGTNDGVRGGIAGSFPISGPYGRFQFLNWAAKFYVDALLLEHAAERRVEREPSGERSGDRSRAREACA